MQTPKTGPGTGTGTATGTGSGPGPGPGTGSGGLADGPGRDRPYHHGALRAELITAALASIAEHGVSNLSLRDLARRAGVSHAAPAHHFGDKTGLLTAVAAQGFELLADATGAAWRRAGSFLDVGVAYVAFATAHPAHFEVMFRPDLYRGDDPALAVARERARATLDTPAAVIAREGDDRHDRHDGQGGQDGQGRDGQGQGGQGQGGQDGQDAATAALAAWALMHGLATLWLTGNVTGQDPQQLARAVGAYLFPPAS